MRHPDAVEAAENLRTGERVEFVAETDEVLTMISTWTRSGHRASEHVHPVMEERYEVLEGEAAFRVDGVEVRVPAGGVVVVPPGRRHVAWNPTDSEVRLCIEMRPPLRWREFTARFFAGEDPIALLDEFDAEVRLP